MGKWQELFNELGLKLIENHYYAGEINGYKTVLHFDENNREIEWHVGAHPTAQATIAAYQLASQLSNASAIEAAGVTESKFIIKAKLPKRLKETKNHLAQMMQDVCTQLKAHYYETGCFKSGVNDGTVKLSQINDTYGYYSEASYQQAVMELESKKVEYEEKSHNLFLGLIGSIPGVLLGGLLWGVISYLGYYAWFAASIGALVAIYGYRKLGGKITILGAILVELLLVASIVAANVIEYAVRLYNEFKYVYDVTFIEVLKETPNIIIEDPAIREAFIRDLLIGVLVGAAVGIFAVVAVYREERSNYTAKRLED